MKRLVKSKRGISTVLATLMMIVIAVAGSLVTYAWVMGYLNFTTAKAGNALQIQSISNGGSPGNLIVYVQNVGQTTVTFASGTGAVVVYVKGAVPAGAVAVTGAVTVTAQGITLGPGSTAIITITNGGVAAGSGALPIKVQAIDGTFAENTFYP